MRYDELKQLCRSSWKKIIGIFELIDLKREIKEDIIFVRKAKTHTQNVNRNLKFFGTFKC